MYLSLRLLFVSSVHKFFLLGSIPRDLVRKEGEEGGEGEETKTYPSG
jgi:hypothetical protein